MNAELFQQIIGVAITIISIVLTYFIVPYLKANTSEKQREDALYWIKLAVGIAEKIYKDKGVGSFKKEWVLDYLVEKNIKLTEEELDRIIDDVVSVFNEKGWNVLF